MKRTRVVEPVQLLRALAAWMVVYHHYMQIVYDFEGEAALAKFFSAFGSFGVDIFFVISGFVMYYSLSRRDQRADEFFGNRLVRIVPNYWFYTLVLLLLPWAQEMPNWKTGWTLEFLGQSLLFLPAPNPMSGVPVPFLIVGWTLSFEMFFYALLATCLLLCPRYKFVLATALLLTLPLLWPEAWPYARVLASALLVEFALGIALCASLLRFPQLFGRSSLLGLTLFSTGFVLLVFTEFPARRITCAGLVVGGALCWESRLLKNPLTPILRHLGDTSYSVYLSHTIVISLFYLLFDRLGALGADAVMLPLVTVCTYLISLATYRWIERGWGNSLASWAVAYFMPGYARAAAGIRPGSMVAAPSKLSDEASTPSSH